MATTSTGKPYPLGTDKVVDGDDAIKALALAVDAAPGALAYLGANVLVPTGVQFIVGATNQGAAAWSGVELSGGVTYDPVTGVFVLPVPGLYLTNFVIRYDQTTAGANRLGWIENEAASVHFSDFAAWGGPPTHKFVGGARIVRFPAGQRLRVVTFHDAGATIPIMGAVAPAGTASFVELRLIGA
jgi:hypothetical protein